MMMEQTLEQRCKVALECLPDARYRAMLAGLFDELLSASVCRGRQGDTSEEQLARAVEAAIIDRAAVHASGVPEPTSHKAQQFAECAEDGVDDFAMACLREVAKLDSTLEHTRYWYGQRMERLSTLAREELDEPLRTRFFSIVANGSPDVIEPPTSAQNYNAMKARAETAESELVRLRASATAGVPAPSQPEPVPCVLCTSPDYCATHGCRQRPSDVPVSNGEKL